MASQPAYLQNMPMSLADLSKNIPALISAVVVGAILYTATVGIYNVYFSPLKDYPGPWLCAASGIPQLRTRFLGNQHIWITELHKKYGPVVRVAPKEVSYIVPEAWKDIYGHRIGNKGNLPKDPADTAEMFGGQHSILFAFDEDHVRIRRLLSHAFSDKAMREQEPLVRGYVDLLVKKLSDVARESKGTKAVDMVDWYGFTTFDIIADLTFGEELGMLKKAEWIPWLSATFDGIKNGILIISLRSYMPTFGPLIDYFTPQSLRDAAVIHITESEKRVDARLAREADRPDIWSFIERNDSNEKRGLSLPEKYAMGKLLMIAGTETSATVLSGMTHFVTTHPETMRRVAAEIRGAFPTSEDINMTDLARLPYLHGVMEETLRLYPSVPLGTPRVSPKGGRIICGKFMPEGTRVYLSHYASYHSEENFALPEEFHPERWLPDMPDKRFADDKRDVMQAFSFGPRNCLGKNLAYNEIRLIFAKMMYHFDLEGTPENKNWNRQKVYGFNNKTPLMIKPVLRK